MVAGAVVKFPVHPELIVLHALARTRFATREPDVTRASALSSGDRVMGVPGVSPRAPTLPKSVETSPFPIRTDNDSGPIVTTCPCMLLLQLALTVAQTFASARVAARVPD